MVSAVPPARRPGKEGDLQPAAGPREPASSWRRHGGTGTARKDSGLVTCEEAQLWPNSVSLLGLYQVVSSRTAGREQRRNGFGRTLEEGLLAMDVRELEGNGHLCGVTGSPDCPWSRGRLFLRSKTFHLASESLFDQQALAIARERDLASCVLEGLAATGLLLRSTIKFPSARRAVWLAIQQLSMRSNPSF
jgi:hypothetical protein